jgi:putative transposase
MWKKQYAGLGVQELRELRSLRDENSRQKRIVADLTLDRQILQEIVSKKLSYRILTVIDQFPRECVAMEADRSLHGRHVVAALT